MKFAVVKVGAKQYLVQDKETFKVDLKLSEVGQSVELETLLTGDGKTLEIGHPKLDKSVVAEVISQNRSRKVDVVKYKRKTRYKKTTGHRQDVTTLKVKTI